MDMKLSSRKEERKVKQKGGRIEICSKKVRGISLISFLFKLIFLIKINRELNLIITNINFCCPVIKK